MGHRGRVLLTGIALCAGIARLSAQESNSPTLPPPTPASPPRRDRLQLPPELPGATVAPLRLPPTQAGTRKERDEAIKKLFPPLPSLGPPLPAGPGPMGKPLTLADLQEMAQAGNPTLRQAVKEIEAARGAAIQAGLYPNPSVGYEADQINTAGTAGLQGGYIEQIIKTGGKLELAQAAASIDVLNAQIALRRAEVDVATQVRGHYFAVLVAQETFRATYALAIFTDDAYRVWTENVFAEQAAPFEPMQLRVLVYQVRGLLIQARNRYDAAWKQLAASLGQPALPPTQLAGRVDAAMPAYTYDRAWDQISTRHTEITTALNNVLKGRYLVRLAQVTPVPDVRMLVVMQKDMTVHPHNFTQNVQVGVPLPVFDRNQGGIRKSEAELARAEEEVSRVRNELAGRLATAFERYQNNQKLIEYYRVNMLPDQVQAYRGLYQQYTLQSDKVSFTALLQAQQNLLQTVTSYLGVLGDTWSSVVEMAGLLQTDDLFQNVATASPPALDPIELLLQSPCDPPGRKQLRKELECVAPATIPVLDQTPAGTTPK